MNTRVLTKAAPAPTSTPVLQQRRRTFSESPHLVLQRRPLNNHEPLITPPIVHEVLRSPGKPLDPGTRAFFEPRFGHDFSKVSRDRYVFAPNIIAVWNRDPHQIGIDK
ncbi:hypothetical protein ANME2D_02120 [Candidatus Methanoperedens nitroreducens]|uniref:Uncharacterized protein n=1 Tax=Candidatus Methanoperedens nitratireducens TaxID=1392998 RepID=A0A062V213_9EURY|nr:hypothetical protein ANME2D_02120 [Candidatus Methanoperedens nitroreducens]